MPQLAAGLITGSKNSSSSSPLFLSCRITWIISEVLFRMASQILLPNEFWETRPRLQLTQEQASEACNVSQQAYSRAE